MLKIKKRNTLYYVIYSAIIALGVILDQLTKWLAVTYLKPIDKIPIINGFLHLDYDTNTGMAFSMLDGADERWIFITVSSVLIVAMSLYLYFGMPTNTLYAVSISMVISGGIGNMIDRVFLGYVHDFIYLRLINATFNGADSFVCIGAGLLIFALIRDTVIEYKKEKAKKQSESKED